jgi:hypothetical protein
MGVDYSAVRIGRKRFLAMTETDLGLKSSVYGDSVEGIQQFFNKTGNKIAIVCAEGAAGVGGQQSTTGWSL